MLTRKRETERIERENHAFAKRLFDKQGVLNKRSLDREYHEHLKYKKQIAKMPAPIKSRLIVTSDMRRSENNLADSVRLQPVTEPVKEEPIGEQEPVEEKKEEPVEESKPVEQPKIDE